MKINKYKNTSDNICYQSFSCNDNENPNDFFKMCLDNKLYKQNNNSHMYQIFMQDKYKFTGFDAIVALKNNVPIGIIYNKRTTNQNPPWKDTEDYKNHLNTCIKNNQHFFIHPLAKPYDNHRNRKTQFQEFYPEHIIHCGYVMFYITPEFRQLGLSTQLLQHMEQHLIQRIEKSLPHIPEIKDFNKIHLSCTSAEKANELIQKHSKILHTTQLEPYHTNFTDVIGNLTNTVFFHKILKH